MIIQSISALTHLFKCGYNVTYFCVRVWIIFENGSGSCLSYSYLDLCNRLKDLLPAYIKNISSSCKKRKKPLFKR